ACRLEVGRDAPPVRAGRGRRRAMAATIAGTFETPAAAQLAVERLQAAGVPAADISMIVRDRERAAAVDAESGIRGGAAVSPPVIASRPDAEPVLTERVVRDEVEPEVVE